jgi:UDP-N-acetylglucosamine:LPS N-acetylglucosamine transferase
LPSIFIPNTAPGMDDQQARAQFAQDAGAAIELPQSDMGDLPDILKLMMQDSFRSVMRQNCESLASGNGAAQASALISQLVN